MKRTEREGAKLKIAQHLSSQRIPFPWQTTACNHFFKATKNPSEFHKNVHASAVKKTRNENFFFVIFVSRKFIFRSDNLFQQQI